MHNVFGGIDVTNPRTNVTVEVHVSPNGSKLVEEFPSLHKSTPVSPAPFLIRSFQLPRNVFNLHLLEDKTQPISVKKFELIGGALLKKLKSYLKKPNSNVVWNPIQVPVRRAQNPVRHFYKSAQEQCGLNEMLGNHFPSISFLSPKNFLFSFPLPDFSHSRKPVLFYLMEKYLFRSPIEAALQIIGIHDITSPGIVGPVPKVRKGQREEGIHAQA